MSGFKCPICGFEGGYNTGNNPMIQDIAYCDNCEADITDYCTENGF